MQAPVLRIPSWLLCLLLSPALGCNNDGRLSLSEMQSRQAEYVTAETPTLVTAEQLGLMEIQPYTISPGDVLSVTLTGLSAAYVDTVVRARVQEDGTITLPLVGPLKVGGTPMPQIDRMVHDAYVPAMVKDLAVYVEVTSPEATTVMVTGAAGTAGPITLRNNQRNVFYAVALAGGFGPAGSGTVTVRPILPGQEEVTYDLGDINGLRRALSAPPLQSGDMIFVEPSESSAIFVIGLVNSPGPIPVAPHGKLSLVRTVASAGGLRDLLEPEEATLYRRLPDGEQVRVKLNIADMMAGDEPDIALLPGDVLDVPHTVKTRFREWFFANIRVGPFGVGAFYDPVQVATFRDRQDNDDRNRFGVGQSLLNTLRFGVPNVIIPPVTAPP